ncbi:MAG TPA: hypothetical protein VNS09_11070 [Solirubrobacter sp.]|nr:hypothetical protein [Solirubrobacter sp.]
MTPGLGLALLASLGLNGGYVLQHLGARGAPAVSVRRPVATLRGLLASPVWAIGMTCGTVGWALYVLALARAPLALVQAFTAGGVALVVAVAARLTRAPVSRRERQAVGLMCGALALLAIGATDAGAARVPSGTLLLFLGLCAVAAAAIAAAPAGRRRGRALALAAGVLYGASDTATKAATVAVLSPWAPALLLGAGAAFFCFQRGLQLGPVVPVIALMTVATNAVAIAGGLIVFGEPLGTHAAAAGLHAFALAVICVAGWWLAGAQARLGEPPRAGA